MKIQRHVLGALGALFLVLGLSMFFAGETSRQAAAGIFTRVGFLMGTIWLAWPQLQSLKSRSSFAVLTCIIGVLLVVAVRPRLLPIAVLLIVGGLFLNGVLRRLSSANRNRPD